jgi:acetyltransferase-like isoleucine patch superfamily enzyme
MQERVDVSIHSTAEVSTLAHIGTGTSVWNQCQVREYAQIGSGCILGKDVYIDFGVQIGNNVKIQNGALIYHGVTIASGVFIGPGAVFTNDRVPRAINPDGTIKRDADWQVSPIQVGYGASIGAGAIILPGVTIGEFALVGAGAIVTRDVPRHVLVIGNPARPVGYVCKCAARMVRTGSHLYRCPVCGDQYTFEEAGA